MNDTLKVAGRIGAELGAAKAELQREMERHRKTWRQLDSLRDVAREALAVIERLRPEGNGMGTIVRLKAALSEQPEPTDTFTAVDMATAAAQGFRDGQAAVEQAVAQDERDAFYAGLYKKSAPMWHRLHELAVSKGYDHVQFAIECAPVYRCDCMGARKVAIDMAGNTIPCECVAADNETEPAPAQGETEPVYQFQWREIGEGDWMACSNSWFRFCEASPELDTRVVEVDRPAQTEQQPAYVECRECTDCGHVGINDAHPTDATCAMCDWSGPSPVEDQCPDCGKENAMGAACPKCSGRYRILAETHVAAPIAQTAPQPEQSGLVEALGAFVSLAEDRLHELGALSPEMAECLANGRAALSAQGESHE